MKHYYFQNDEDFEEPTITNKIFRNLDEVKRICVGAKKEDLECYLEMCQIEGEDEHCEYIKRLLKEK
jgi:hypothetical protein